MANMTITITLTSVGLGLGPFDIYTDDDNYTTPVVLGISTAVLFNGYVCPVIPDTATIIKVKSTGEQITSILLPIEGRITTQLPTPTPTPTNTPQPTPGATPTPTPTISPSANVYTVSFVPIVITNLAYRKQVKSYVTVTPALPSGHSFILYYENYVLATSSGSLSYSVLSKTERRSDVISGYWDRASAFINNDDTVDEPHSETETNTGKVKIDSTIIESTYFYAETIGDVLIDPQSDYHLNAKCRITNIDEVTGGGTYVIDNTNYLIEVTVPDL